MVDREANPFPEAVDEPKTLHYGFIEKSTMVSDLDLLEDVRKPSERYELTDEVFCLHAPEGLERPKLAVSLGKAPGALVTSHSHRTVQKLIELSGD